MASLLNRASDSTLQSEERSPGFAQVSQESIITWAETVGIADLSPEIGRLLSGDATYRLRQAVNSCLQHLHACKRRRLTPDDFNRALRWMDVPPVLGHSGCVEGVDWLSIPEVGVHVVADPPLNLASTAVRGDIYHQPGNPCVKGEWAYITNHVSIKSEGGGGEGTLSPLTLSPHLTQYYHTLVSAIFKHSNTVFKRLEEDLSSNPCCGPLVGAVVSGCLRGAQIARQNPCILRRVLLVVRAMLSNTHMHVGHAKYVRDIMSLIVFCVVTERKQSNDTHPIRSLATNTMLKVLGEWSEGRIAWDVAVSSLGGVIASTSRPWSQHCGALTALLALGPPAQVSLLPYYSSYYSRLQAALAASPHHPLISTRDAGDAKAAQGVLMAVLVKIASSYVRSLPDNIELNLLNKRPLKFEPTAQKATSSDATTSAAAAEEPIKTETKDCSSGTPVFDAPKHDAPEDQATIFSKLRQVYAMGENWFGSAFVLQIPSVYLCLHKSQMPSFMESHIYKEMETTGEALLKDMLNREQNGDASSSKRRPSGDLGGPFQKRRKHSASQQQTTSYDLGSSLDFTSMDFESLIGDASLNSYKNSPEEVFSSYKRICPLHSRVVPLNIQGCGEWNTGRLKRPKGLLPQVTEHIHRHLLVKYYNSKSVVSKMPHCKFTRPSHPKIRPGYTIQDVIL